MSDAAQRRAELAAFLRKRRSELDRSELGLPPIARSRTTGLRREDVAYQAAVSLTWYTWLEQGRDINPSPQVLAALAGTLRLSAAEHDYILMLAGHPPLPRSDDGREADVSPPHLQQLLDALMPSPAFLLAPDWHIAGWNDGYRALYPRVAQVPPRERNLLWVVFTDSSLRAMLPDWRETSRRFVAEYRAEVRGPRLARPRQHELVGRLSAVSEDFASAWADHEIERFSSRERRFSHPTAGDLVFEQLRLEPSDHPGLHVIVYLAHGHAPTLRRMSSLVHPSGD